MFGSESLDSYRREGYLKIESVFSKEELVPVRTAIDRLLQEARELKIQQSNELYELELSANHIQCPVVKRLQFVWRYDQAFRDLACHEKILEGLVPLLGPDIELHHSKAYLKPPTVGTKVGLHQDCAFFPHSNDDVLAVMVYLDDSSKENGCLQVIPGSHRNETLPHKDDDGLFIGRISDDIANDYLQNAKPLSVRAGGLTIHHYRTIHFSEANLSPHPRWAINIQYRAADSAELIPRNIGVQDECFGVLVRGERPHKVRCRCGEIIEIPNRDSSPQKLPRTADLEE